MNTTIVIYGSSTGTCEVLAEKIASKLGCEALNVQNLSADMVAANKILSLVPPHGEQENCKTIGMTD